MDEDLRTVPRSAITGAFATPKCPVISANPSMEGRNMRTACTAFCAALCLCLTIPAYADHDEIAYPPPNSTSRKLGPVSNLGRTAITVSGLSSGGFFAHQFHVAFSKLVQGAGIIAGGPFGCVENIPNPYF